MDFQRFRSVRDFFSLTFLRNIQSFLFDLNQGFSWIKPYIFGAAFRIRELPVFCARTCHFTAATRCSRGKQGNILNERSCLVGDIVDVKINQQATQPSAAYQACPRPVSLEEHDEFDTGDHNPCHHNESPKKSQNKNVHPRHLEN